MQSGIGLGLGDADLISLGFVLLICSLTRVRRLRVGRLVEAEYSQIYSACNLAVLIVVCLKRLSHCAYSAIALD